MGTGYGLPPTAIFHRYAEGAMIGHQEMVMVASARRTSREVHGAHRGSASKSSNVHQDSSASSTAFSAAGSVPGDVGEVEHVEHLLQRAEDLVPARVARRQREHELLQHLGVQAELPGRL